MYLSPGTPNCSTAQMHIRFQSRWLLQGILTRCVIAISVKTTPDPLEIQTPDPPR